jgi:hypothetical protein
MTGKRRYLIALLVACAAVSVAVGLARPTGGMRETVKTVPAEIKNVEKEANAKAEVTHSEGNVLGATDADWNAAHTWITNTRPALLTIPRRVCQMVQPTASRASYIQKVM